MEAQKRLKRERKTIDKNTFSQEEKDYFLSIGYVVTDTVAYSIKNEDYFNEAIQNAVSGQSHIFSSSMSKEDRKNKFNGLVG